MSNKKRSIVLQTLYMDSADYQKKKSAKTLLMQNAVSNTPKTQVGQTSIDIIPQPDDAVNLYDKNVYSDRSTDTLSNCTLLAEALKGITLNDIEKNKFAQYSSCSKSV